MHILCGPESTRDTTCNLCRNLYVRMTAQNAQPDWMHIKGSEPLTETAQQSKIIKTKGV